MSHVIEVGDEVFARLEKLAAETGQSPEAVVEGFILAATGSRTENHYYELDEWFRHLGMTNEEIAEADAELEAEEATDADTL